MKLVSIFSLSIFFLSACQTPPVEQYTILPQPQEISYTPGFLKLGNQPVIAFSGDLENEVQLLKMALSSDFSMEATVKGSGKGDINLELDPTVLPDKKEGYQMDVASGKVSIKANSKEGILNGVQTLRQAIKEKDGKYVVQQATLTDYPAFSWRAFMLDEGR